MNKDESEQPPSNKGNDATAHAQSESMDSGVYPPRIATRSTLPDAEHHKLSYRGTIISESQALDDGKVRSTMGGDVVAGEPNEPWVAKILAQAIGAAMGAAIGETVTVEDGENQRGIDRYLRIAGRVTPVQITSAIRDGRLADLSRRKADERTDTTEALAGKVLVSIGEKVAKTTPLDRSNTILAIDAQQTPAATHGPVASLVAQTLAENQGFQYKEVWLVGIDTGATCRVFPQTP